ncbi:MAG: hypothetical protein KAS04_06120 [Candidatus Aenigmarchaeota archaeon]|nr:hypothetical protein [Candidatus Aenigmarchaeota archaeon]
MKKVIWFLFTIFRKTFGLVWYWFVFPFRRYARSVVQNYALAWDTKTRIKRLDKRKPKWSPTLYGYILRDVHSVGRNGLVKHRYVSKLEFWLVVFLIWGWLDDDSNHDTYDAGHLDRYLDHDKLNEGNIFGQWWRKSYGFVFGYWLRKAVKDATYGNTFDLGDLRAETPNFSFPAVLIWNTRNTAYNFWYLFGEHKGWN